MAIKFVVDGPRGRGVDVRRRVQLILGFFQGNVPELFWDIRAQAMRADRYLKIDLVTFVYSGDPGGELVLTREDERRL